jgi:hypothetical protein
MFRFRWTLVNILHEVDKTTIQSQQPDDQQQKRHNNKHKEQQNDTRSKPKQNKYNKTNKRVLKQLITTPYINELIIG